MYGLAKTAATKKEFEDISGPGFERDGVNYGVSIGKDKDGYFAYTHRARSKSYESPEKIPKSKLEFIDSTG